MPKVTITGTTEQIINALRLAAPPVRYRIRNGMSECATINKRRGDAQKLLLAAFKIVRYDSARTAERHRLLSAVRETQMPTVDVLREAEEICAMIED